MRRAFTLSLLFAMGILVTIGVIGAITAAAGRMMGDVGRWGNYAEAVIFFVVGLYLLDAIRLPMPGAAQPGMKRKGMLAALILGLVFGMALGPCTFAYMAPMLAVSFKASNVLMTLRPCRLIRSAAKGNTSSANRSHPSRLRLRK